jgi:transposase
MIRPNFLSLTDRAELLRLSRSQKEEHGIARRANALILLDKGWSFAEVCEALLVDDGTVRDWHKRYIFGGIEHALHVEFSGGTVSYLTLEQQADLKEWLNGRFCCSSSEVIDWIKTSFAIDYTRSGMIKLLNRLEFDYKKPVKISKDADEVKQKAFIEHYEDCLNSLSDNEKVYFVDAVHPEYQTKPAFGWVARGTKIAVKQTSGRQRLNLHGALCLDDFDTIIVESLTIDATSTLRLLQKMETKNPEIDVIHVFLDNARYHHAKLLKPFLDRKECRVKLHFLPAYCPHLNSIERLWGEMHKNVTHNKFYKTFKEFAASIHAFFDETVPKHWKSLRNTVTDSFRVINYNKMRIVSG